MSKGSWSARRCEDPKAKSNKKGARKSKRTSAPAHPNAARARQLTCLTEVATTQQNCQNCSFLHDETDRPSDGRKWIRWVRCCACCLRTTRRRERRCDPLLAGLVSSSLRRAAAHSELPKIACSEKLRARYSISQKLYDTRGCSKAPLHVSGFFRLNSNLTVTALAVQNRLNRKT